MTGLFAPRTWSTGLTAVMGQQSRLTGSGKQGACSGGTKGDGTTALEDCCCNSLLTASVSWASCWPCAFSCLVMVSTLDKGGRLGTSEDSISFI